MPSQAIVPYIGCRDLSEQSIGRWLLGKVSGKGEPNTCKFSPQSSCGARVDAGIAS